MKRPDSSSYVGQQELAARIKRAAAKSVVTDSSRIHTNDILAFAQGILWEARVPLSFTYVSPQAESILGYPLEDWYSDPYFWQRHMHPEDRQQTIEICNKAIAELRNHELTYRMLAADGSVVWLQEVVTVVKENNGEPKLYGLTMDITEQKAMEFELQQLRQMLQLVMDTIPDAIFWKNRDSVFLGCNKIFAQQAGLKDPNEIMGKTDYDLPWTKEQSDLCRQYDREVINNNKPFYHISETQLQADGQVAWLDMNKLPLHNAQGEVIGVLGTYQNVTEQVKIKQALEQHRKDLEAAVENRTHELSQVNRELNLLTTQLQTARDEALAASNIKSDFVANISHEMRSPLAGIIGTAELLADTELDREQLEHLETIRASADHLLIIINNVLDLNKIESGRLELESIEFNPIGLLENTVALLGSAAQSKQLSLVSFVHPLVPNIVTGDPVRLKQILLNLIANAIKFTQSGEIFISCQVQATTDNTITLRFSVQDTGIGIAPAMQHKLFQPFGQLDKTTTRRYGGTGLGLSICKKLVKLMNGDIGVRSHLNTGSTFWFTVTLPGYLPQSPCNSHSWYYPTAQHMKGKRILIAAATENTRKLLTSYLDCTQADIYLASTTEEALAQVAQAHQSNTFDAAIIEMASAQDLLDSINANATTPQQTESLKQKIVLLSTDAADEHLKALNVLIKPFARAQLVFAVCKAAGLGAGEMEPLIRAVADRAPQPVQPIGLSPTVMLVEDNLVLQRLGKQQLAKLGVLVHPVSSGEEALELLFRSNYDLIFMDCQMPGMDGWQTTQQIRALEERTGKHIPIVAMTASAMSGDREKCIHAGMDDYLSKPVRLQELRRILNRWIV